jgi:phosphoribosylglycinamide formyltransferase-1
MKPAVPVGIACLASGRGSNFEAIARAIGQRGINAELRLLVANTADAPALARAGSLGIPAKFIDHRQYARRADFERALVAEFEPLDIGLVCLAGFMRVLSPFLVRRYAGRVMNIHPSLLPAFAGLQGMQVHEAAIAAGVKFAGCTVHFVTTELDAGPIIVQRAIPVRDTDTAASLALRVLVEEHLAYAEAVELFCAGRLSIDGRRVMVVPE